jgi:hypothetical protein
MNIPLCRFLTMLVVKPTLKIDVFKMEQMFFTGYWEGARAFYISSQNCKGEEEEVNTYCDT